MIDIHAIPQWLAERDPICDYYGNRIAGKHAVISFTGPGEAEADIKDNSDRVGLLRLVVDDVKDHVYDAKHDRWHNPIAPEQADRIIEFVSDLNCTIIVHCLMGISRSAGCAGALGKIFNGSDAKFFNRPYVPNHTIYWSVLRAFNKARKEISR